MITLITYDISDNKKRGRLHKFLKEFGVNTQKSVFECRIEADERRRIVAVCKRIVDPFEDSVRVYRLCRGCYGKTEMSGAGLKLTEFDFMVI